MLLCTFDTWTHLAHHTATLVLKVMDTIVLIHMANMYTLNLRCVAENSPGMYNPYLLPEQQTTDLLATFPALPPAPSNSSHPNNPASSPTFSSSHPLDIGFGHT